MINNVQNTNMLKNFVANSLSVNPIKTENLTLQQSATDTVSISKKENYKYKKYAISALVLLIGGVTVIKRNQIGKIFSTLFKNKKNMERTITVVVEEPIQRLLPVKNIQQEIIEEAENIKPKYVIDTIRQAVTKHVQGEQAQKEIYSSKIYELAGVKVPEMKFIGGAMNYLNAAGIESQFIGGLKDLSIEELSSHANICRDFGADILLSNKNILKSCKLDKNNNLIRVNLSETLGLKPDDSQHYFGSIVDKLSDFLNPEKYPQNAKAYSSLTRETLISSSYLPQYSHIVL